MGSSFLKFLDHSQRRTTVGRTPLDEWSARRRDLYLTTHNTHNRQTSMPPLGFEPTISAGERPQTYALDRGVYWDRHSSYHIVLKYGIIWKGNSPHLSLLRYSILEQKRLCLYTKGINAVLPGVRCVNARWRNLSPKSIQGVPGGMCQTSGECSLC